MGGICAFVYYVCELPRLCMNTVFVIWRNSTSEVDANLPLACQGNFTLTLALVLAMFLKKKKREYKYTMCVNHFVVHLALDKNPNVVSLNSFNDA